MEATDTTLSIEVEVTALLARRGSKEEVTIPLALAEQHLAGPGGCRPGEDWEDSLGAAVVAPPGPVRTSRQVQPGGKLKVENIGQCRNL